MFYDAACLVGAQLWVSCKFLTSYPTTVFEWRIELRSDDRPVIARGETSSMKLAQQASIRAARKYLAQLESQPVASSSSA